MKFLHPIGISRITFSSDAYASLPFFDASNTVVGLAIGDISSLFAEVRDAVIGEQLPLEMALRVITANPAKILRLPQEGQLRAGTDAGIVIFQTGVMHSFTRCLPVGVCCFSVDGGFSLPLVTTDRSFCWRVQAKSAIICHSR